MGFIAIIQLIGANFAPGTKTVLIVFSSSRPVAAARGRMFRTDRTRIFPFLKTVFFSVHKTENIHAHIKLLKCNQACTVSVVQRDADTRREQRCRACPDTLKDW